MDRQFLIMEKEPKDYSLLDFGEMVRRKRKELGISQEELAEKSGMHRTYIGMVERGEKSISLLKIINLAKALEIHIKDLF